MRQEIGMKRVIDLKNVTLLQVHHHSFRRMITGLCSKTKIKAPYSVRVEIETSGTINNKIDPILNAIEDAGVIDNDENILTLVVNKSPLRRGSPGALRVYVGTIGHEASWD